jgi:hypothetical protein
MASNNVPFPPMGGTVAFYEEDTLMMPGKKGEFTALRFAPNTNLLRGAVIGVDNAGMAKLSVAAATDGSEVPLAVCHQNVVVGATAKTYDVMVEGSVNETALIFGAGHTADTVRVPLMKQGIYMSVRRYSHT